MKAIAFTAAVLILICAPWESCHAGNVPLTIADAIETVRDMKDADGRSVFVSPDGLRYATLLIRGDVPRDGVWAELVAGRLDSFEGARPVVVARLFSRGLGAEADIINGHAATRLTGPVMNCPHWIDNRHVTLLWEGANNRNQAISVDVDTRRMRYLTHGSEDVMSLNAAGTGRILFASRIGHTLKRSEDLLRDGFAVSSPDALPLLGGIVDGTSMMDFNNHKLFVGTPDGRTAGIEGIGISRYAAELSPFWGTALHQFSPNGEWALVDASPGNVSATWQRYTDDGLKRQITAYAKNPDDWYARQLEQLFLVNLSSHRAVPVWDAPTMPYKLKDIEWSPDGHSVLLGGVFLPPPFSDSASLSGRAVAEVDIATGRAREVPFPSDRASLEQMSWVSPHMITITLSNHEVLHFERQGERWLPVPLVGAESPPRAIAPAVRVEMREDLNSPPALFAVDVATGREQVILELDPELKGSNALGHVEFVHWKDANGLDWKGRLYYPVHYSTQRTYPIVIQTHGYAGEKEFSLYGPGGFSPAGGPGWSVFLAQPLANRDVAVLQIGGPTAWPDGPRDDAEHAGLWASGVAAAVEYLAASGLVDITKVGLMGHSATGRLVEHAITFSKFQFAAAIVADSADTNYLQNAILGWREGAANWHGTSPFGDGLRAWIEHSPSFNVQLIHTPVQYQLTSATEGLGSLLFGWEMFSRLRYLRKPVEYYIVPDLRHGNHFLQNPRQLIAVQTRAMDWWLFWLTGQQDFDPRKTAQYVAWHRLQALRQGDVNSVIGSSKVNSPMRRIGN
jgi:hypothetical protein